MRNFVTLFILIFIVAINLQSKEPPTEPVLRINTEMHSAPIIRLDTDGRYIVTGSHDKTIKLWDGETGQLIRTYRVPIDEGNEGKIFSVAISPDGKTIAAGGWTGYNWTGNVSIYIFDRVTGFMKKKIGVKMLSIL